MSHRSQPRFQPKSQQKSQTKSRGSQPRKFSSKYPPSTIAASPVSQHGSLTAPNVTFRPSPFSILNDSSSDQQNKAFIHKTTLPTQSKLRGEIDKISSILIKDPLADFDLWCREGIEKPLLEKKDFIQMAQILGRQEKDKAKMSAKC